MRVRWGEMSVKGVQELSRGIKGCQVGEDGSYPVLERLAPLKIRTQKTTYLNNSLLAY